MTTHKKSEMNLKQHEKKSEKEQRPVKIQSSTYTTGMMTAEEETRKKRTCKKEISSAQLKMHSANITWECAAKI